MRPSGDLEDDQKDFVEVWKTYSTQKGIYFQSNVTLFRRDSDSKSIKHKNRRRRQKREMALQPAKISVSRIDKAFLEKLKDVIKKNLSDPDFTIEQMSGEMNMNQATRLNGNCSI
jgi:hypothetical protein